MIYEYRCKSCGTTHSMLRNMDERELPADCPNCGSIESLPIMSPTRTTFRFADEKLK